MRKFINKFEENQSTLSSIRPTANHKTSQHKLTINQNKPANDYDKQAII